MQLTLINLGLLIFPLLFPFMSFKLLSLRFSQSREPYPYTICNDLPINQHTVRDILLCFGFFFLNILILGEISLNTEIIQHVLRARLESSVLTHKPVPPLLHHVIPEKTHSIGEQCFP